MNTCSISNIGGIGELGVAHQLAKHGWTVFTPIVFENVQPYDLLAVKGRSIHRIQVKSTSKTELGRKRYAVTVSKGSGVKTRYTSEQTDYIVACVIPTGWYFVFPVNSLDAMTIRIPVDFKRTHRYAGFKDAWHLLDYQ